MLRFRTFILLLAALSLGAFAEPSEQTGLLQIGIVADVHAHDLDSPLEGKMMTSYPERLGAFVNAMNAWPADLIIELGDFVNGWVVLGVEPGDPYRIPQILCLQPLQRGVPGTRQYYEYLLQFRRRGLPCRDPRCPVR
jgi:hypothetical protein